ncbi:phage tail protein [Mesorhizobium sp. M0011]|uniref:phage tail protein n=1 Tax=Mesorhizobium sp. M0011 TaxID=2956839 RepID=UPI003338EDEC
MNFRFLVEIDGIQRGGFARVKGIAREIKVDTYREGGVNDYEHKFVNQTTYGNLVLERGLVDDFMWSWHDRLVEGDVKRRPITIVMRDSTNNETWRWLIDGALPVKWSGTDLDAASSQIVVESIELAHRGFRKGK